MATIQERKTNEGKTSYRVMVRLKGYPAQSATFERKTDAKRWAVQTEAAIREGRHFKNSEAKRRTLGELIDRYTRDVLPTKKAKTQGPQAAQLAWWKNQLGHHALADITPALLAAHRDKLAKEPIKEPERKMPAPYKRRFRDARQSPTLPACPPRYRGPATINRYLAALSHCFTVAIKEWGWVEDNPLLKVSKPKEPRGRVRFLSEDSQAPDGTVIPGERTRFLEACKASRSPDLYLAVVLALSTGARAQEILGMHWGQIDLVRRVALLDDPEEIKNSERRALPLTGHALELLKERAKIRRIDTDLVFPGRTNPNKRVDLRTPFDTALKAAGIEDFRWHDLRHSAASYLAMGGASLAEIAEVLGHKTLAMVKRYAHLSETHTANVVERMNNRIFGGLR